MIPSKDQITIQFAHVAYRLAERFALRDTGIAHFQTWSSDETTSRLDEADVLVLSGFWHDDLLAKAPNLKFIQICAAGYDQFGLDALQNRGVRLANGAGVNANAVSEHAMALILALMRQIHVGRDNQRKRHWRGMISDLSAREDELPGKTVLIFGSGTIGGRIARLARAFDTHVIGVKRNLSDYDSAIAEVHPPDALLDLLPRADVVVLTCPLTPETERVINAEALAQMKSSAFLVNVSRGGCVDEMALVDAVRDGTIAGAGIDVTSEEPLPASSPLWDLDKVIITPHTGGETRSYEDNVIDVLLENLERLWRGDAQLLNQII